MIRNVHVLWTLCVDGLNIEVMAKAKNHTDNFESVTLCNIETNSAFVKRFVTDYPISLVR